MSEQNVRIKRYLRYWWLRPSGGKAVMAIALPLVLSTASWTLMHFCDRMFLMWYSKDAFAASMPAGMVYFTLFCFPMGLAAYVTTFVAQYFGAGERNRIGRATWQGVWIGLAVGPLFLATIPLASFIFFHAGHASAVQQLELVYYQTVVFGAGGGIVSVALSSFFTGIGRTRVVMVVNVFAALMNIFLDVILIFGLFGCPELGMVGAAAATVVAQWIKVASYIYVIRSTELGAQFGFAEGWRPDFGLLRRIFRFGAPSGLQVFIETAAFSSFILIMGRLGKDQLAANTLAFTINMIAFLPILGIGMAVSTLVGQQLGRNRPDLAARATWTALILGSFFVGTLALLFVLIPEVFLMAHFAAGESGEFDSLRNISVVLLRFVAAYTMLDMVQIIFVNAIKGAGDTRFVLIVTTVLSSSAVVLAILGEGRWNWHLYSFWFVLTFWICALGIVYLLRFLTGKWRDMRVIEQEYLNQDTTMEIADDSAQDVASLPA